MIMLSKFSEKCRSGADLVAFIRTVASIMTFDL
jgi:hypothetical protein